MTAVAYGSATDAGRLRRVNEDSVLAEPPVFLVADGMGGHAGGGTASELVVDRFRALVGRTCRPEAVSQALLDGNARILDEVDRHPGTDGMGTTVAGLVLIDDDGRPLWLAFNVGDSRIYRLTGGDLARVSTDHSYVQELVDAGEITPEDAARHPQRNIVTRALGSEPAPEPDFWLLVPTVGERFLLCSDGLTGEVPEDAVRDILADVPDPASAALRLVEAAVSAGGRDNVSAVVVDTIEVDRDVDDVTTVDTVVLASNGGEVGAMDSADLAAAAPAPDLIDRAEPIASAPGEAAAAAGAAVAPAADLVANVPWSAPRTAAPRDLEPVGVLIDDVPKQPHPDLGGSS